MGVSRLFMRKILLVLLSLFLVTSVFGQSVMTFNNFAELTSPNTNPENFGRRDSAGVLRATVDLRGYYAPGDGGAASYRWLASGLSNTNQYGGRVAHKTGAWELIHNGVINAAQFGAVGKQQTQIPPYWNQEAFTTAIGTGDVTLWAKFRTPAFDEFPQGLIRIKTQTSFARLLQLSIDQDNIMVDLISTGSTNDASAGLVTSAGYWSAANTLVAGETNELALVRSGTNITIYLNGSPVSGTYVNQQAFGESLCATTSNYLEVGQGWKPNLLNNELWFRDRIFSAKVWNSAVTSGWEAAGGALASATQSETDLVDYSSQLQAAIDWLAEEGGGTVNLSPGVTRIGTAIDLLPLVTLSGVAPPAYTQGRSPYDGVSAGTSVLLGWYGMTTNLIQMTADNANVSLSKVLNAVTSADLSIYTSYIQGSTIKDIVLDGSLMMRGHGIYVLEMSGWNVRDNIFRGIPGSPVFSVAANAAEISGNKGIGASRGGLILVSSADMDIGPNNLWGSTRGPAITLANANKNRIKGNHLFNALLARDLQPTVDAGTDTFTVESHNFNTGDLIQFSTLTGTLPSPLDSRVHYWVIRIDEDTFKVNSQRDQGSVGGALQGVALDITDAGSGTWWVVIGGVPSNLVIFGSDQNEIVDNTLDQAAQDAITLYNADRSTIVGNMLTEYGYNNSTYTNAAAVRFLFGSDTNSVSGNMIGNRFTSTSFGWYGLFFESGSDGNSVGVNATQPLTIPIYMPSGGNSISPTFYHQIYGDWAFGTSSLATDATTGFLLLPRIGGENTETPDNDDIFDGIETYVDSSNGHFMLYISDLWRKIPYSATDGRWTFNNTSNGIVSVQIQTADSQESVRVINDSDTGASGPAIGTRRARGTSSSRAAVQANDSLLEIAGSGYHNSNNYNFNVGGLTTYADEAFTSSAAGTRTAIRATPRSSTSTVDALLVYGSGQVKFLDRTSAPSVFREGSMYYRTDTDLFYLQRSTATTEAIVTDGATQTLTAKTTSLSASLGTDDTFEGQQITGLNNTGGVTQWDVVYLNGSSQWVLADANGTGTYPARGIVTATVSTGNATSVIVQGTVRNDAWNWTPGGTIYLSTTAGGLTQTAPATSGDKVQQVGFALTADIAYFDFASGEYLTVK